MTERTHPSPAHTLARLAALEAALQAWVTARQLHLAHPANAAHLDQYRQAEQVLMTLAERTPPPERTP